MQRVGRREADLLLGAAAGVRAGDPGADGGRRTRVVTRQPAARVPDRTLELVLPDPGAAPGAALALEEAGACPGLLGLRDAALGGGGQRLGVRLERADQWEVGVAETGGLLKRPAAAEQPDALVQQLGGVGPGRIVRAGIERRLRDAGRPSGLSVRNASGGP